MQTTMRFIVSFLIASLLCSSNLLAEPSPEQQLIEAVPKYDMDKDGQLTPSEIWYARTLRNRNEATRHTKEHQTSNK